MHTAVETSSNWVEELVRFLRTEPAVSAVRIDPASQKVAVATIGNIPLAGLEQRLAETIAAIEASLTARAATRVPGGYSVRREGEAMVVGRDHCVTAETLWLWRELKWPE